MKTGTENMTTQALDTFVTKRRSTSKNARKTPPETSKKQQKGRLFRKKRKKCRRILANRILLSNFANSKKHRYPVAVASRPAAPTGGRMRYAPTDWQLR